MASCVAVIHKLLYLSVIIWLMRRTGFSFLLHFGTLRTFRSSIGLNNMRLGKKRGDGARMHL